MGIIVWVLNGGSLSETPIKPEDLVLMLSPESNYFRKLSQYIMYQRWYYCSYETLMIGETSTTTMEFDQTAIDVYGHWGWRDGSSEVPRAPRAEIYVDIMRPYVGPYGF